MERDGVPVLEQAGAEALLYKVKIHAGDARPDVPLLRRGTADGFAGGKRQRDILVHIGSWLPEAAVGLVPHLPQYAPALEVAYGGGGKPCKGRARFVRAWRALLIEVVAIVQDKYG